MPVISFFKKNRKSLVVPRDVNLMKVLLKSEVPVASSCLGDGVCGKCKLSITAGSENLSAINETEKGLREKFELKPNQRISCQSRVQGDIELDAGYW